MKTLRNKLLCLLIALAFVCFAGIGLTSSVFADESGTPATFVNKGAAIRVPSGDDGDNRTGIKFVMDLDLPNEDYAKVTQSGILLAPTSQLDSDTLDLENTNTYVKNYSTQCVYVLKDGENGGYTVTAYIYDIEEKAYNFEISARGYYYTSDSESPVYTETVSRSVAEVALTYINENDETAEYYSIANGFIKDYTVTYKNGETTVTQSVRYGSKATNPTDGTDVKWYLNDTEYDFENATVKGDMTLDAKSNVYKVNTYKRNINGTYAVISETKTSATAFSAENIDGYTVNATKPNTDVEANEYGIKEYSVYYENNDYDFRSPSTISGNGNGTYTSATMIGDDARSDVYLFTKTVSNANTQMKVAYNTDDVGKYMLFHVYYTTIGTTAGVQLWTANNPDNIGGDVTDNKQITAKTPFGTDGKSLTVTTADTGKWLTFALYLDEGCFPKTASSWKYGERTFYISFCHSSANTLYIAEYAVVSADVAAKFYETSEYYKVDINGEETKCTGSILKGIAVEEKVDGYKKYYTSANNINYYCKEGVTMGSANSLTYATETGFLSTKNATMTGDNARSDVAFSSNTKGGGVNGVSYVDVTGVQDNYYLLFNICFASLAENGSGSYRIAAQSQDTISGNGYPAIHSNGLVGFFNSNGTSTGFSNNFTSNKSPSGTFETGKWYTIAIKIDSTTMGFDSTKKISYVSLTFHSGKVQSYYIGHYSIVDETTFKTFAGITD